MGFVVLALIGYTAGTLMYPSFLGKENLSDFDVFHLVSTMISEGNLKAAYDADALNTRLAQIPGARDDEVMFWSYPPHFNLFILPLQLLQLAVSYFVFMVVTLAFYVFVIRALSGPAFHTVAVLFLPLVMVIIRGGQNAFLTGGLIGLTCLLALRKSRWSGLPLGLMAIKPHLALGVGIWSLLDRRWGLAALSLTVVAMLSLLATIVFGTDIWSTSLEAIGGTTEVLRDRRYPLFRMTSIYAFALSFGIDHHFAMLLHVAGVIVALGALITLGLAKLPSQVFMGAGVFASALISPDNSDYDLAMLAAASCLLFDTVAHHASKIEKYIVATVIVSIGIYGVAIQAVVKLFTSDPAAFWISLLGPMLFVAGIILFRVIWRSRGVTA
jgi:hypothetical protein